MQDNRLQLKIMSLHLTLPIFCHLGTVGQGGKGVIAQLDWHRIEFYKNIFKTYKERKLLNALEAIS